MSIEICISKEWVDEEESDCWVYAESISRMEITLCEGEGSHPPQKGKVC
jgi:hypothetical protein